VAPRASRGPLAKPAVVELQRDSRVAMYRQIAHHLRDSIASGKYGPGDKIPTEPELSECYGVSRITARQAVEHLVREGLVARKQGKGTFVLGPLVRHDLLELRGIYDELVEQGLRPETELLEYGEKVPPAWIAEKLDGHDQPTLHWRRLYRLSGKPFGVSSVYLNTGSIHLGREMVTRLPTYELLRSKLGVEIVRADVAIRYEAGKASACKAMGLPVGTPLMVLERVSYAQDGRAREHTVYYAQASSYQFSIKVRGPLGIVSNLKQAG
jgi:GntR family transcriptional regulator